MDESLDLVNAQLKAHAGFLRSLARRLVLDPHLADDLEQEAWMAAIRRPPAEPGRFRAWVTRVVRNTASQRARDERRRRERERRGARPEGAAQAAAAARARDGLVHDLVEAVLALDEPYRSTVLRRFYEDRPPRAIAAEDGVSVRTVETRLRRGLERVRRRLERTRSDDGSWRAALAPIAGLAAGPSPGASAWWAARTARIAALAVGGLVTVAALLLFASPDDGNEHELAGGPPAAGGPVDASPEPRRRPGGEEQTPAQDAGRAASVPPASAAEDSVAVDVRWSDGTAAAGVVARLLGLDGGDPDFHRRIARADAKGRAIFTGVRPGRYELATIRGGGRVVRVRPRTSEHFVLDVPEGIDVDGVVLDHRGSPVAGASVWLSETSHPDRGAEVAVTDAGGRFFLRSVRSYRIAARAKGLAPSARYPLPRGRGVRRLTLPLPGRGGRLSGRVVDSKGHAVAGARLLVGPEVGGDTELGDGSTGTRHGGFPAESDEAGRFLVEGLAPGDDVLFVRAPGFAAATVEVVIDPDRPREVTVELAPEGVISGAVRDAGGRPRSGVEILVRSHESFQRRRVLTDERGRFRLGELAQRSYVLDADAGERGSARTRVDARCGQTTTCTITLRAGAALEGRAADARGEPLVGWRIVAYGQDPMAPRTYHRTTTGADGRFRLAACGTARHVVEAFAPPHPDFPTLIRRDVRPGGEPLQLRLTPETACRAWLSGRIVGAHGQAVTAALVSVLADHIDVVEEHAVDPASARFSLGPLPKGSYVLFVRADGYPETNLSPIEVSHGQRLDLGDVALSRPGTLIATLRRASGRPVGVPSGSIVDARGIARSFHVDDDRLESPPLPPGRYTLRLRGANFETTEVAFEIAAGETTAITVVVDER